MARPRKNPEDNKPDPRKDQEDLMSATEGAHDVERLHETPAQSAHDAETVPRFEAASDWARPSSLDAPPPRPGMVQRWKRHRLNGETDTRNWQRAMREGWRPRSADSVNVEYESMKSGDGLIAVEGLVLCEMPIKVAGQREAFYAQRASRQMQGVDQDLYKARSPGGPVINKDHQSRTDKGRLPEVAD